MALTICRFETLAETLAYHRNAALAHPVVDIDSTAIATGWFTLDRGALDCRARLTVYTDAEAIESMFPETIVCAMWRAEIAICDRGMRIPLARWQMAHSATHVWARARIFAGVGNPRFQLDERGLMHATRWRVLAMHEARRLADAASRAVA